MVSFFVRASADFPLCPPKLKAFQSSCGRFLVSAMKELASWALNIASLRGASYADVRVVEDRSRALSTKNGKIGTASDSQSLGFSVRVIIDGAWGFASSA